MFHYNQNIGNNIQISQLLEFCLTENKLVDIQEKLQAYHPTLTDHFKNRLRFFFRCICFQAGLFCSSIRVDKRWANYEISLLHAVLNNEHPETISPIVYEIASKNLADLATHQLTLGDFTLCTKRDPYIKEKLMTMLKCQQVSSEAELMRLLENKMDFIRHCLGQPPTNTKSRFTVEDIRDFIDMDALQAHWSTPQPIEMNIFTHRPWIKPSFQLPIVPQVNSSEAVPPSFQLPIVPQINSFEAVPPSFQPPNVPQENSLEADFISLHLLINESILEIRNLYTNHKSTYHYYVRNDPNYIPSYIIDKSSMLHQMQKRINWLIQRHEELVQKYEGFPTPELPKDLQTCSDFIKNVIEKENMYLENMYLLETLLAPSPPPRSLR